MNERAAFRIGWSVAVACIVLAVPTLVLIIVQAGEFTPGDTFVGGGAAGPTYVLASLAFSVVGALIVSRQPENAVGWIFCAIGLLVAVGEFTYQYADRALYGNPGSLPAGEAAAWMQNLGLPPAFGLLALSLLLFPDGKLPSRLWRPAVAVPLGGIICLGVGYAVRPGALDWPFATVVNPLGIGESPNHIDTAINIGWWAMGAAAVLAGVAMVVRFRDSSGVRRQQLKWIALASVLGGLVIFTNTATFFFESLRGLAEVRSVALGLVFSAVPLAAGVGILRYRLYDIDVVINRALVYTGLTATLAGVYIGSVLLFQLALSGLTSGSGLAVAASTLAVAALFRPARERIQETVDRRFYRHKYDAQRTLEEFAVRMRDEVDLESLTDELRAVVRHTMEPTHVTLWLRSPENVDAP